MSELLKLGLVALGDADSRVVFGDAVLEAGWYDERVMPLLYPTTRLPERINAAERKVRKAALAAQTSIMYTREHFDAAAGKASPGWVRAVVAVLLFGGWQKGRWAIKIAHQSRKRAAIRAAIDRYREELLRGRPWRLHAQPDNVVTMRLRRSVRTGEAVTLATLETGRETT